LSSPSSVVADETSGGGPASSVRHRSGYLEALRTALTKRIELATFVVQRQSTSPSRVLHHA